MQKVTGSTLGYLKHDTVEKCAVVIALPHEFHEIVAVKGSFVVKADCDVAQCGVNLYLHESVE